MRIYHFALAVCGLALLPLMLRADEGILDLTALGNYAHQTIPAYITRDNTPANNAITDAAATLGRVLFHDKRLSRNDTVSCSSCHQQSLAFGALETASTGVAGMTGRHTTRLINDRFGTEVHFFWDERATSLESQATQPIQNQGEMGFSGTLGDPTFADLLTKLSAIPEYRVLFTKAFGSAAINETKMQQAIAQFVRSIQSFDSKYDIGRAQVNNDNQTFPNFTSSESNGKQLFLGTAGCAACHRPPEFDIDPNSKNNGIIDSIAGGTDLTNTRSPSLRDSVGPGGQSNGPFMHNGVFTTLAQVINHYDAVPNNPANTNLDPRLRGPGGNLNLSPTQKNDLVAFMTTLTGSAVYTDARWSNPFSPANNLSLVVLPASSMRIQNIGGTVTVTSKATAGLQYQLEFSSEFQYWTPMVTLTADSNGNLSRVVVMNGPVFYRFTFTPPTS